MTKWKLDPVLRKAMSSGPYMFGIIVPPLIERFGGEVKQIVYDALYNASYQSGQALAKKAHDVNPFPPQGIHGIYGAGRAAYVQQ